MTNSRITIQQRTENFAVRVRKAYCELNQRNFDDAGKILAKQFLRSGTSMGANCLLPNSEFRISPLSHPPPCSLLY